MKRLFKLSLVCWTLMTLLCGSVIVIAKARVNPTDSLIPEFAMCGQTPCYLGMIPDHTLIRDAGAIIARKQVDAVAFSPDTYDLPRFNAHLHISGNSQIIDEIDISLNQTSTLLAGEVIQRFGEPCYATSLGTTLAVKYPHLAVFFSMDKSGESWILRPRSHVIEIRLLGGASKDCLQVDNKTIFRWRGFSSY